MNAAPALDHVVIVVRELDAAVRACEAAGFTVAAGGRHPGRNTRNALVVFADGSYLELIAYEAPSPDERWWRVLAAHGAGLVDFSLLPQDLDALVAGAQARGLAGLVDRPGARTRPDGTRIAWRSARPATSDLPFLCFDTTPRALRVPEGDVRLHANGAIGIAQVRVCVRDLAATLARYRAYLGEQAVVDGEVPLAGCRITFAEAPRRARDEGPCGLSLRYEASRGGEGRVEPLDIPLLG